MTTDKKVILITGASSGIGKATAIYFAEKGWDVAATMRNPKPVQDFNLHPSIRVYKLDVTDKDSIKTAIDEILKVHSNVDVLFNNAGYALAGAFEATTDEEVKAQFETNLFGVMNVTRAILPQFRRKKSGMILNTTSSGGIFTFPLYSIYNSTKWALEGFMEALQYELKNFNIVIKNLEPAHVKSEFTNNISLVTNPDYEQYTSTIQHNMIYSYRKAAMPDVVAKVAFKAATDNRAKLRYPATPQMKIAFFLRWLLPLTTFNKLISKPLEKEKSLT